MVLCHIQISLSHHFQLFQWSNKMLNWAKSKMETLIWVEVDAWDFDLENTDVLNFKKSEFSFKYAVLWSVSLVRKDPTNEVWNSSKISKFGSYFVLMLQSSWELYAKLLCLVSWTRWPLLVGVNEASGQPIQRSNEYEYTYFFKKCICILRSSWGAQYPQTRTKK